MIRSQDDTVDVSYCLRCEKKKVREAFKGGLIICDACLVKMGKKEFKELGDHMRTMKRRQT